MSRSREDKLLELAHLLEGELHDRGATTDQDPLAGEYEVGALVDLCLMRGRALRNRWSESQ